MKTGPQICFADMPTAVRLMVVALGLVVVSEFFRALVLSLLATHGAPSAPSSMALAGILMFGIMRALGTKNGKAPIKAAMLIVTGLLNDGYAIFAMRNMFDSSPWVSLWWPASHFVFYLGFIAVLFSPATASFYKNEGQAGAQAAQALGS